MREIPQNPSQKILCLFHSNVWFDRYGCPCSCLGHEAMKSKRMKPVVLQIYDYVQMFDSIDLEEALNDIYNVGVDDDTLTLLHQRSTWL